MQVINQKEIKIFGIRRSGNHSLISWIIHNYPGVVIHFNDIMLDRGLDPYKTSRNRISVKGLPYWKCKSEISIRTFKSLIKYTCGKSEFFALQIKDKQLKIEYIRQAQKDCFIYNYEDIYPTDEKLDLFEEDYETYIGLSNVRLELIILRDPLNLFASLLQSDMIKRTNEDRRKYLDLYKAYAQEFISPSVQKNKRRVYINYNQWFLSPEYRIQLAKEIGFFSSGEPHEKVMSSGKGSSFDQLKYVSNASQMKVLERWKNFQKDPFFREIVTDSELQYLSSRIFGENFTILA